MSKETTRMAQIILFALVFFGFLILTPKSFAEEKAIKGFDGLLYYEKDSIKKEDGKVYVWLRVEAYPTSIKMHAHIDCKTSLVSIPYVCDTQGCKYSNIILPYENSVHITNTFCKMSMIDEIIDDSTLLILIIIAFIIDTINSFLRASTRRFKTYSEFLLGAPLIFHTYFPFVIFLLVIIISIAILGYGIYSHGFFIGIISCVIPWIAGKIVGKIGYKLLIG